MIASDTRAIRAPAQSTAMAEKVPNWKFYHPLSIWKTLGLFLFASLFAGVGTAVVGMMFDSTAPSWLSGGLGGLLGVVLVTFFARRAQRKIDAGKNQDL
jgi:hypothetical protein